MWWFGVIDSIDNGQWSQACDQLLRGCRSKPEALAARGIRLCGVLYERRGDDGLRDAAKLMDILTSKVG